jgi:hypothetical protein
MTETICLSEEVWKDIAKDLQERQAKKLMVALAIDEYIESRKDLPTFYIFGDLIDVKEYKESW